MREIDTEIYFLGDFREDISRFFAVLDPEDRGEPTTHWGIVRFSGPEIAKSSNENGDVVITKLRIESSPGREMLIEKLLEGKIFREADYESYGDWITLDDIQLLDQEIGTL